MRAGLLLALVGTSALADPRLDWDGSSLVLARCPDADCWIVELRNEVSIGGPQEVTLDLDGFEVVASYGPGLGGTDAPDTLTVIPPPGWVAEPPSLVVPDGETGVIVVRVGVVG